jgi:hypothetical protein
MSLSLAAIRIGTIILLTPLLSSCASDLPQNTGRRYNETSGQASEKKLLCSKATSEFVDDIVRSGARVRAVMVKRDLRETPFADRKNALVIQLASPESVGVAATPAELEAGIRVVKNESAFLFHGKNIMQRCTGIASVSVSLHELDSEVYLHRDHSAKPSECVDVEQNPHWGQRICT